MDTQLKKGVLEIAVLASLLKQDSYGYKIIQDLADIVNVSESTLYPILRRLEAGGYLEVYSQEHNSRLRKMYHITSQGIEKIKNYLADFKEIISIYEFVKEGLENEK